MEANNIEHLFEHIKADYRRIELQHRTYFTLREKNRGWEACTLININKNRKGIGIRFHTDQEIRENATVTIDLSAPGACRPVCYRGIIRWIRKTEEGFIGGIELTRSTDKLKSVLS